MSSELCNSICAPERVLILINSFSISVVNFDPSCLGGVPSSITKVCPPSLECTKVAPSSVIACLFPDSRKGTLLPFGSIGPGVLIPNTCDGVSRLADDVVVPLIGSGSNPCFTNSSA